MPNVTKGQDLKSLVTAKAPALTFPIGSAIVGVVTEWNFIGQAESTDGQQSARLIMSVSSNGKPFEFSAPIFGETMSQIVESKTASRVKHSFETKEQIAIGGYMFGDSLRLAVFPSDCAVEAEAWASRNAEKQKSYSAEKKEATKAVAKQQAQAVAAAIAAPVAAQVAAVVPAPPVRELATVGASDEMPF